jgi:outer membrane receptor protein involved in Fe transport
MNLTTKNGPAAVNLAGSLLLSVLSLAVPVAAVAEETSEPAAGEQATEVANPDAVEEMIVIGRYKAAATDVVSERIESEVPMDFLDAEGISRVGDSNVAMALRRVPGVTLVQDQFVYVRGLGERYSSSLLNGTVVPSPDLTRNVLPLDIFPAEIIDSLSVQKGYSPDMPAAFGGGAIDIRTKAIPEDAQLTLKLNTGWNSDSDNDGYTYHGGSDDKWGTDDGTRAIPQQIVDGIQTYRGNFSPVQIQSLAFAAGDPISFQEAQSINRELATSLNRDIDLQGKNLPADFEVEGSGGYRWFLGDDWELGFLAVGSYNNKWRNRDRTLRFVQEPDGSYADSLRTIHQVSLTAGLNVGLRFTEDHEIRVNQMFIRNTEDEATSTVNCRAGQYNDCTTGVQERLNDIRFEQRDLDVTQVIGEHKLGDATLSRLPDWLGFLEAFRDTSVEWFYSTSKAETDLPNEVRAKYVETFDQSTGEILTSNIRNIQNALVFQYSGLTDDVETWGGEVTVPFSGLNWGMNWDLEVSGGGSYNSKGRSYQQTVLGLGTFDPAFAAVSDQPIVDAFSDANVLDPIYNQELVLGIGQFGTESYGAGQTTSAGFGKIDLMVNDTWRLMAGARWEDFSQVSVPIDYLNFNGQRIPLSQDQIEESVYADDNWYPAVSLTYIQPGFWADEFQLRFAWSETVAYPDIREVSASTYIDPLTEARVRGNPNLVPSDLTNYEIRSEWFWNAGDSLSASLFYKDLKAPIETVQGGATEDNILFTYVNAESGEVYGLELEGLKSLGFLSRGGWTDAFYVAGNATFSDSKVNIPVAPGVGNLTNQKRRLTQQSKWVVNAQLGFDSFNGKWGATVVYNAFGPRVFYAGIDGNGDAFEQPFHSLDVVGSWFPTEHLSLKLRLKNILNDKTQIEQENTAGDNVTVLEQTVGTTFLFDIQYEL